MRPEGPRRSGYSMVELLTVIAIIAIMAGVGLGTFVRYGRGSELAQGTTIVKTVLAAARQASVTRGVERRVAIDLRNEQLWLERKIDEGRGKAWSGNSVRAGDIVHLPRFVDIADINSALGLLHNDSLAVFPPTLPAAIFYVVFNSVGNVTEISAGNLVSSGQTSFSIHLALKNDPIKLTNGTYFYDSALITSGQLSNLKGKVGVNATDKDAAEMLARSKVLTITVLGNTGRIQVYPFGKNTPWNDARPTGVLR